MRRASSARTRAMFIALAALGLAGACSVSEKQRPAGDAGADAPADGPVDSDAPDTMIEQGPEMFSRTAEVVFRFSSNEPSATFMCRVDTLAPQPCSSPFVASLAEGPHTFSVRAVDIAGNSDDSPAERVWTIDTTEPDTTLLTKPPMADNSDMVVFTFDSNEENVTFECSLDSAAFAPCESGGPVGPVLTGMHTFLVRARDRAGNVDSMPALHGWTVDTSTPDTRIDSGPADASGTTSATFMFISPDAGMNATFQCAIDGGDFTECSSPREYTGLREGAHTFSVRVRDQFGNFDPVPATRTWTVDLTPPDTTITAGPPEIIAMAIASFSFTSNEANAKFACSLDDSEFTGCVSPFNATGLAQGAHSFAVRATDAAGHPDMSPARRSWTVDTVAPNIAITAGPAAAGTSGPRVAFAFTVSEGNITCSFDAGPFGPCASPIATNLAAGAHQFKVSAVDTANNITTVTRAWSVACSAPDPAGAAGLLHLDDTGQTLANAVAGGASAMLGDAATIEPMDPVAVAAGRFGGALVFTAADSDRVAWPIALPAMPDLTIELWAQPAAAIGTRDIAVSGDGRVALRATAISATTVAFSIAIAEGGVAGTTRIVSSAVVAAGAWHHVLASLQQPALRLWVDGARTEVDTVQLGAPLALDSLRLGGSAAAAYEGGLDEVWVAQTAITADEPALTRYCPL